MNLDMNEEQNALLPAEQRHVIFYDDELTAVVVASERGQTVYVPIRPICERLGLDWSAQRQRINRDPVLSESLMSVVITTTDMDPQSKRPRTSAMSCLPLNYLNGWLFGINANRVNPDLRDKVIRYQRECYDILAAVFLPSSPLSETFTTSLAMQSLQQVKEMATAIIKMADEQMTLTTRIDKAAVIVGEHGRRLTSLEQQLAPRQAITEEQAADIAEKVKALALQLTENDGSKNHFQGIFAELYRRFRVSSYKSIRQSQYHLVLDFLDEWANAAAPGQPRQS